MSIMEVKNVGYTYDNRRKVLRGINVQMEQGKLYAILGPSGCGKTTLLSLIGGLDSPTSGQILFEEPGYCEDRAFRPPEESCVFHFPGIQPDRLSESKGKCSPHLQAAAASHPGAAGADKRRGKAQRIETLRRTAAACGYRTGSGQ